jgi:hypothetical protein
MSQRNGLWHLAHRLLLAQGHGLHMPNILHGLSNQAMPGLEQPARCLPSLQ